MSTRSTKSTSRSRSRSSNNKELSIDNKQLLRKFLLYYMFNIVSFFKDKKESKIEEQSTTRFKEAINLICDLHNINKSLPFNDRIMLLFKKLQIPLLENIKLLKAYTEDKTYELPLYYIHMHGEFKKKSSISTDLLTVPKNVVLVFTTPINKFGICQQSLKHEEFIAFFTNQKNKFKIVNNLGCFDKNTDLDEANNAAFESPFMSRATVLYPGQLYCNMILSFSKETDTEMNSYKIVKDKAFKRHDVSKNLNLSEELLNISDGTYGVQTFVFISCCRTLDDIDLTYSNPLYEYEHFIYYFNLIMSNCQSLFVFDTVYEERYNFSHTINYNINFITINDSVFEKFLNALITILLYTIKKFKFLQDKLFNIKDFKLHKDITFFRKNQGIDVYTELFSECILELVKPEFKDYFSCIISVFTKYKNAKERLNKDDFSSINSDIISIDSSIFYLEYFYTINKINKEIEIPEEILRIKKTIAECSQLLSESETDETNNGNSPYEKIKNKFNSLGVYIYDIRLNRTNIYGEICKLYKAFCEEILSSRVLIKKILASKLLKKLKNVTPSRGSKARSSIKSRALETSKIKSEVVKIVDSLGLFPELSDSVAGGL
jgi:hypothetical protein